MICQMMLHLELSYVYVDDVLLYSSINTIVDCQTLQEDLDRLMQWADRWQMNLTLLNVKPSELQIE